MEVTLPFYYSDGQWGAFLHVRGSLTGPSKEAVVYSGKNNDGISCDWMLAWNTALMNYQSRATILSFFMFKNLLT